MASNARYLGCHSCWSSGMQSQRLYFAHVYGVVHFLFTDSVSLIWACLLSLPAFCHPNLGTRAMCICWVRLFTDIIVWLQGVRWNWGGSVWRSGATSEWTS